MSYLKQSTTSTIKVGPILSTTDLSAMTSATLTVKLSKNGGTLAARHSETASTHDADGYYNVELDATDSGTCGELTVAVTATGAIPWTKTYSIVNELAYTELMGNKHDAVMLREAMRQGYDPAKDTIALWADTSTDRGTNLKAAYTAAKSLSPTVKEPCRVFVPKWIYKMTSTWTWDTDHIHIVALDPVEGYERVSVDDDRVDGIGGTVHFKAQFPLIYSDTANVTTVTQSAQYVRAIGLTIAQLSGDAAQTGYHAFYISADTNQGSVYDRMNFFHSAPMGLRQPVAAYHHFSGLWNRCHANSFAFRNGKHINKDSVFSATMRDGTAGPWSYIGDTQLGTTDEKASRCDLRRCRVEGSITSKPASVYVTKRGAGFAGCDGWGTPIDAYCIFIDCEAEEKSFGIGVKNEGFHLRCLGRGQLCFGATYSYSGEFAGTAIDSFAQANGFGGNNASDDLGVLSGTLIRSVTVGGTAPHRLEGATIIDTVMTMATADQPVVTLLDSASKIHNSTILPVEDGTSVPIYAASALSVSAAGNTYGNKAVAANGLGANVTNLATIDVVPKVDLTTAATSVTNAVTTDSPSREASKADVSTLATATNLAAAKTVIDAIDTNAARLTATRAGYIDALATPANFKADLTGIAKITDIPTTTINNSKTILDKFDSMIAEDS